jgi:hypothetical protein
MKPPRSERFVIRKSDMPRLCQDGNKEMKVLFKSPRISPKTRQAPRLGKEMRFPKRLLIFATYIPTLVHASPVTSKLERGIDYCDGPNGPKQGAGCNNGRTATCCVDSMHSAKCNFDTTGSTWSIYPCSEGCMQDSNGDYGCDCEEEVC